MQHDLVNSLENHKVKTGKDSLISLPLGYWWNYPVHHMPESGTTKCQRPVLYYAGNVVANSPPIVYLSLIISPQFCLFFLCFPSNFPISSRREGSREEVCLTLTRFFVRLCPFSGFYIRSNLILYKVLRCYIYLFPDDFYRKWLDFCIFVTLKWKRKRNNKFN